MDAYVGSDLRPEVESGMATFSIMLPATDQDGSSVLDALFSSKKYLTRKDVQDALGLSRSEAVAQMNLLVREGKVVREGSGRGTRYRVVRRAQCLSFPIPDRFLRAFSNVLSFLAKCRRARLFTGLSKKLDPGTAPTPT